MRAVLTALTDELKRLKATGVRTVSVSEANLAALRGVVQRRAADAGASRKIAAMPDPLPSLPPVISTKETVRPLPAASSLPPPPVIVLAAGDKRTRWTALRERVLGDAVCRAHVRPGKQVVFGVGDIEAKIFFCGEAPGAEEEQQGEPFVGPAGQLLNKMIQGMGLRREDVYIGNIMNWRPEMPTAFGNRPPNAEEMAYCLPFLRAQIEVVDPALIVALGATAARGLLGADNFKSLGEIRGHWKQFAGKPVMVTYHPSYLLHNDTRRAKRAVWEDLVQVMERAGLAISEKQRCYYL
ncbi:MAG TPA: uracil-DNA glycosylase [Opitutaceae bacterium]|jgi:uracil-DNA glycosylase family 4|nr:uracil-DNA glycosylase [Opitutaceae bacterium]